MSGKNGCRGVPVGSGGDEDCVNIIAGEELTQIAIGFAILVAILLVGLFLDGFATRGFDIAYRYEPNVALVQKAAKVISAPVANANATEDDSFAGRDAAVFAKYGSGNKLGSGQERACLEGTLEKQATSHGGVMCKT
jgi:hypothetical protein